MDIVTERIITAEGVGGYLAYPRGRKSPVILVHFEIFGVNSHIEDICRRLAGAGYAALAPDYFWRLPVRTAPYTDVKSGFALAATLTDDQIIADAGSVIQYLRSKDFVQLDAIGSLGFCMGGRIAILIAENHPQSISAAVAFYGGGLAGENMRPGQTRNTLDEAAKLQAPVLLIYGGKDQLILPEHVERFTGRLRELGKTFQSKVYPDAGHGFNCNERGSFHPESAQAAWQQALNFFNEYLNKIKTAGD